MGFCSWWFNWKESQSVEGESWTLSWRLWIFALWTWEGIEVKEQMRGAHRKSMRHRVGRDWLGSRRAQGWTLPLPQLLARDSPHPSFESRRFFVCHQAPHAIGSLFSIFKREKGRERKQSSTDCWNLISIELWGLSVKAYFISEVEKSFKELLIFCNTWK